MAPVPVNLDRDQLLDIGEVDLVLRSIRQMHPVAPDRDGQPRAHQQAPHPPLEYGTRKALDSEPSLQDLRHRSDPVAARSSEHLVPRLDLPATNGAVTFRAVECLFDSIRWCDGAEVNQRAGLRGHG